MNLGLLTLMLTVGQPVHPAVPPPALPPAPFLFVTVKAHGGGKVTWYPGTSAAASTNGPVGLRPGYPYRFQIDGPTPEQTIYPSIEVRGSLVPRPELPDVGQYPVPITLSERDIDRIREGKLVTKVFYLEDPDQALPIGANPGEALESFAVSEEDAVREARLKGRPMMILRVGERTFSKNELAAENVPGTIYFMGMKTLPVPAAPPRLPFVGIQFYDPIIGMKGAGEECLKDGGDVGPRLGVREDGTLGGLDPTDTAMQFNTRRGAKVVASNRVCICAPRFVAVRVDAGPQGHHGVRAPEGAHKVVPVNHVDIRSTPAMTHLPVQPQGSIGAKRPSALDTISGPTVYEQWSGRLAGMSSIKGIATVAQVRGPDEITSFPNCNMLLQKRIEGPAVPKIGDEVTVFLRFSNTTTETMTDVVISDNLTARLEYIEGSAKTSRGATFTASNNGIGSTILRWTIDGKLVPGETGVIMFKAKIK